ncbi:MAG: PilZ domain-containing protein [Caulobacterales bacterium]
MGHQLDTTAVADRRAAPRTPTNLRGKVFPGGLDCVIKDHSPRGARLLFTGPPPEDDHIVVVIWSTGIAVEAHRRWRRGAEAGWQFLNRFDLRGTVPERLAEAKAQWLNRRRRIHRSHLKHCPAMMDYRGISRQVRLS